MCGGVYEEDFDLVEKPDASESSSDIEKYEEYSRKEANVAFIEELGRKYAGEVY